MEGAGCQAGNGLEKCRLTRGDLYVYLPHVSVLNVEHGAYLNVTGLRASH